MNFPVILTLALSTDPLWCFISGHAGPPFVFLLQDEHIFSSSVGSDAAACKSPHLGHGKINSGFTGVISIHLPGNQDYHNKALPWSSPMKDRAVLLECRFAVLYLGTERDDTGSGRRSGAVG